MRSLPSLTLDVAAREALRQDSIAPLKIGTATVRAYTLERIAGERLRAYLSSLPHNRAKIGKPGAAVRVKDIFDLARIVRARPLDDHRFWRKAGAKFKLACRSRFIDCQGLQSFEQDLATTRISYGNDTTIPNEIAFQEAWCTLREIVAFLEADKCIPFEFPLD